MKQRLTYVFAGGGTGGHLFPGIAVAEELLRRDDQTRIVFTGSERGIEREIVRRHDYQHEALSVEPSTTLRRNPVRFLLRNWHARRQAAVLLDGLRPAVVIGLGGFASVPVVLAASTRRIPTLLLEQNIVPGRATRWLSGRASLIALSFDQLHGRLSARTPTSVTGNPVRRRIADLHRRPPSPHESSRPVLLILGGSQGAHAVNALAWRAVERLQRELSGWTIMHQTGTEQHADIAGRYEQLELQAETAPFFTDLAERYELASLAITRGGATSLAELAVVGIPSIIVPLPNSMGNHQFLNARFYQSHGAGRIVEQQNNMAVANESMRETLDELLTRADLRNSMRSAMQRLGKPNAAENVVDHLQNLISTTGT